uniref:Uncharacterized protein n=1 Tax=Parascaris equorum TaxID=6256 RepID=A0A914S0F0_PAREQ
MLTLCAVVEYSSLGLTFSRHACANKKTFPIDVSNALL